MNNKTTNLTLIGFVVLFLSVFTFFTINSWNIISKIKVNGDIYSNIVLNKDLISDILPPPLYILESYTITLEFLNAENQS